MKNKKSQVWIETVIYTLISLIIIGAVLAVLRPKLAEMQDRAVIEGTLEILENINSKIISVTQDGQGNIRIAEFTLKKGNLRVNDDNENITFILEDSRLTYSEPNKPGFIDVGNVKVATQKVGKMNKIFLVTDYQTKSDIEYEGPQVLGKSSTAYKLAIENKGTIGPGWTPDATCNAGRVGLPCSPAATDTDPFTLDTCDLRSAGVYECRHQDTRPKIQITLQ